MAGTAFLPWEKWIARLIHPLVVAFRRWLHQRSMRRSLEKSEGWPETEGTVFNIGWDSSNPREEIIYTYSANGEYYSGSCWRWFEHSNTQEVRAGGRLVLRYNPENRSESVFLRFS